MKDILLHILNLIETRGAAISTEEMAKLLRDWVRTTGEQFSKRGLLEYFLESDDPELMELKADDALFEKLMESLRQKPRRTASGVATITVITKPWPCSGECSFCPSDLRMPKSYLHGEPACLRAEQNYFDPYLQVATRLIMLAKMGHAISKIELIVLGGTWSDYPASYRRWFVAQCLRALNETRPYEKAAASAIYERRALYEKLAAAGLPSALQQAQLEILDHKLSYNAGYKRVYGKGEAAFDQIEATASFDEVFSLQAQNAKSAHRLVGLVFETRPDAISAGALLDMRRLGATKVQIGIQSLNQAILDRTKRNIELAQIRRAMALLRLFGFKIHSHFMVNLPGATPEADEQDFLEFVSQPAYLPDEIKLYPCALIEGTELELDFEAGRWAPYTQGELSDLLVKDVLATPRYCRISRMIRDFSTDDVRAGNDHPNLREAVEARLRELEAAGAAQVSEIRFREIGALVASELALSDFAYETAVSQEHFLEFCDGSGHIAGFLRLSLPKEEKRAELLSALAAENLPLAEGEAMIREVHVYGRAASLGEKNSNAQHQGLGTALVARAKELAKEAGYKRLKVISAVGTRKYYEKLGFEEAGLYQQIEL